MMSRFLASELCRNSRPGFHLVSGQDFNLPASTAEWDTFPFPTRNPEERSYMIGYENSCHPLVSHFLSAEIWRAVPHCDRVVRQSASGWPEYSILNVD